MANYRPAKIFKDENGRFYKDFFFYKATVADLGPGVSKTNVINIEANSDFIWLKCAYSADIAGAAQTEDSRVIPLVRVSITDSGSGRQLQNLPIPVSNMAGHDGLPLNLPEPREFQKNSNISFTFTSYDASATYANVELVLMGYKKFYV